MPDWQDDDLAVTKRLTVLFVDDDGLSAKRAKELLTPLVASFHHATDGREGLFAYATLRPDVVITDIVMPQMDGLEMTAQIKSLNKDQPVIVITGFEESSYPVRAINAGADGYLFKPFSRETLIHALAIQGRAVLANKEIDRERKLGGFLLESIPFPVALIDAATERIAAANQAAARLGLGKGQALAGPFFPGPLRSRVLDAAADFTQGLSELIEDGEIAVQGRFWRIAHRPLTAELIFFMAEDVTRRKRLDQLREDVERITRHDLKSPLNVIINMPDILANELNPDFSTREMLRMIQQSGYKMLGIINVSLDLYKMELGTFVLAPEPVDLAAVLAEALAEQEILMRTKHLSAEVRRDCCPVCPGWSLSVSGSLHLLRSLFSNLARNAAEAAPKGSRITIDVLGQDPVEVRMHNLGAVPEEVRDVFFEKYVTSGKKGGTGLGTYSAALIARAHGGDIGFESSHVQGTTVWVRLPGGQTG